MVVISRCSKCGGYLNTFHGRFKCTSCNNTFEAKEVTYTEEEQE